MVNGEDMWVGYDSLCASYHSIPLNQDLRQCRQGDRSDAASLDDYRTNSGNGQNCTFVTNSRVDSTDFFEASDLSKCGFNRDTAGYCMMRKGDDWFLDYHKSYANYDLTKLNCHSASYLDRCSDLLNMDKDIRFNFTRAVMAVDSVEFGYPLIANNDR